MYDYEYEEDLDVDEKELIAALWEEDDFADDDGEFDIDVDDPKSYSKYRYFYRPLSVRKGTVTTSQVKVGNIRNRIYVNSTFKAMSTRVIGVIPYQSIKQCVFINCNWISSNIFDIFIENAKFINCTFHDTCLDFKLMMNVTFENCTFINSRCAYDDYESNVNMKNSTFFDIYEIVDLGE